MSRSQQDQFIDDDEDETCPLCVEEFDLTDKGFRPCPCGYQICQFCYHNVKTNMNGLCPACRRPYKDENIEYKVITPEETAAHRLRLVQKQKKSQAAQQKEKQKAEADSLSRKHLAGLRVVQKNLVYVTGLSPNSQEDQLLQTLRGDQYFGQYGKIIKIVVSKAKDPAHPQSVGVYVTYERKEDAASCITAVDGSKNGDRTLRAQFGTTKYCSAYLRNEPCTNRNCMFLHEPGEANESYSRADLSALNAGSSQHGSGRLPPPQSQQPVASAAPPMARTMSTDHPPSPSSDRPALPSTASWASKHAQSTRADNRSVSTSAESPAPSYSTPASQPPAPTPEPEATSSTHSKDPLPNDSAAQPAVVQASGSAQISPLTSLLKGFRIEDLRLFWSSNCLPPAELDLIKHYPPLFDQNGGARRRLRREREEEQSRLEQEMHAFQAPALDHESPEMSGSLQLGGEPEDRSGAGHIQGAIHPPGQDGGIDRRLAFNSGVSSPNSSERVLTPQQHQQLLLQTLKPNASGAFLNSAPTASSQTSHQQPSNPPGHQRNVSRYSFANDTASASTAVKPVANQKLMNQQSSMMPSSAANEFGAQYHQPQAQFYTSNVQGPPPGLKTSGTPPVSGNLTFGQGHGFATGGLQYGSSAAARTQQDNYYRELLRSRDAAGGGVDAKRELNPFPNYNSSLPNAVFSAGQSGTFAAPQPYASISPFGDGEKQRKKKGKKHKHANTSSSSGGGVLDGALDPNTNHLLQARLHHGAGLSGGAFAGQAAGTADDAELPPLRAPTRQMSISSRISLDESRRSTPPIPPGFEAVAGESRRGTPALPPGLTKLHALPDLEGGSQSRPSSRPASRASLRRTASQIMPVLPLRPATPSRQQSREFARSAHDLTPTKASKNATTSDLKVAMSVQDLEDEASQNAEERASSSKEGVAIDTNMPRKAEGAVTDGAQILSVEPVTKESLDAADSQAVPVAAGRPASTYHAENAPITPDQKNVAKEDQKKRKHPGKLDIRAAVDQSASAGSTIAASAATETLVKTTEGASQTPLGSKPPESPAGSATSPAIKSAPRTLRVVQTPKTDTPPPAPFANLPGLAANKLPSRQPSLASINPPGTPSSEHVSMSDNISLTSTSQSRTSSPPPGVSKVGSAPVRSKTKSQQKKDRQERAKVIEEEKVRNDLTNKPTPEEPAQEAIVSRKKKAKKEPAPKSRPRPGVAAGIATSVATEASAPNSRPVSPDPKAAAPEPAEKHEPQPVSAPIVKPASPVPQAAPSPQEPSPPQTPTLTAAQIVSELKAAGPDIRKCLDSLFRVPLSHHSKPAQQLSPQELANLTYWKSDFKVCLSKSEVEALLNGQVPAIHYGGNTGRQLDRGVVTPAGAHLRALSKELEARYLELESTLRDMPDELRFHPSKPHNDMKMPFLDLEALKRQFDNAGVRGINAMEQMVQDGSTMKKGAFLVDEASKYINEFVMPPVTPPPFTAHPANPTARGQPVAGGPGAVNAGGQAHAQEHAMLSAEMAERQLVEARRIADERENALKKVIKKNKRLLGFN